MNILGIDFEDWFHPHLIQPYVKNLEHKPTMYKGLDKIIELLRKTETSATFFVVGKLLEKNPEIFDKIIENGHEIGFHTMNHDRIDTEKYKENFSNEIDLFSKLTNKKSKGFRAPTFSLNEKSSWIIKSLEKMNYTYDSSVVPAKTSLYGMPDAESAPYRITSDSLQKDNENGKIIEFPIMITKFFGKKIPAGGGFYLRTIPSRIIENAIKSYERKDVPSVFYIHSWELTPEFMPKIELSKKDSFITYHNINRAYSKMEKLIQKFEFTSFSNFIQENKEKLY